MELTNKRMLFWVVFAIFTFVLIAAAAIRWSLDHPYGVHWDEAQYLDEVAVDSHRLQAGMVLRTGGRILLKSRERPPAYRLLSDPVLALLGFHTATARLVTLACFGLSAWFLYMATKRIASRVAGAFAVLIFCLSPQVVSASIWFSSEGPLYLATSAMLYYLFASWTDTSETSRTWIGLGLALGLGFLSKSSFVLIGLPVLAFGLVIARWRPLLVSKSSSLFKAGVLGLVVAGPWWLPNARSAFAFARWSRGDARYSLGASYLGTWTTYVSAVLQGLIGPGVALVIALVVLACLYKAIVRRERILDPLQEAALGACACAGLPLVIAQASGTDFALRLISPVVIPMAIAVGVLADKTIWAHRSLPMAASSLMFFAQLVMIEAPVWSPNNYLLGPGLYNVGVLPWRVMARVDQWDWTKVKDLSRNCGLDSPRISYLGNGQAFNVPQIQYPWAAAALPVKRTSMDYPEVTWLWRYEQGPIDWKKLMDLAGQSDIVVTAPGYVGRPENRENLDNQNNAEFADRLAKDQRFREPTGVKMGRFKPVDVLLFVNKNLTCQPGRQAFATP
jgi:hypothetical protein